MSKTQLECRQAPRYTGTIEETEPEWLTPKGRIRERVFCRVFLQKYPMVNVNGTFFNEDGIIADTKIIQKEIFDEIKDHVEVFYECKERNQKHDCPFRPDHAASCGHALR